MVFFGGTKYKFLKQKRLETAMAVEDGWMISFFFAVIFRCESAYPLMSTNFHVHALETRRSIKWDMQKTHEKTNLVKSGK